MNVFSLKVWKPFLRVLRKVFVESVRHQSRTSPKFWLRKFKFRASFISKHIWYICEWDFFLEECEMCVLILVVVFSQGLEAPAPQALTSVIRESTRRPVWPLAWPRPRAQASALGSCSWKNLQRATRGAKDRTAGQIKDKGKWVEISDRFLYLSWMCFKDACTFCLTMSRVCVSFSDYTSVSVLLRII